MNNIFGNVRTRWVPAIQQHMLQNYRRIYDNRSLGLVEYQDVRQRYKNAQSENFLTLRKKMQELVTEQLDYNMVFSQDLKHFVYIVENDKDIKLIEGLLAKFNKQNSKLRFGKFVFGPVIMRMYYFMGKPKEALMAYMNPDFDGLFDELSTHIVLMDLLFNHEMYQEVIDVYKITREKQCTFGKHAKTLMVPLFAALYKLNTPESYNYMLELLKEMEETGHKPIRRVLCFAAALALNQNNPHITLELLSSIHNQGFILVRSLKVLATCALDQIDETLIILTSVLTIDTPTKNNHTYPKEVLETVRNHIEKTNRKDHMIEFNRVVKQLKDFNHIDNKNTLDQILCSEFSINNPVNKMKTVIRASLDDEPQNINKYQRIVRPGLEEML